MTTSGQDCLLPLHFNGTQINACITIHDSLQPVCYVDNQGWQVIGDPSCPPQVTAITDCQKALCHGWSPAASQKFRIALFSHSSS